MKFQSGDVVTFKTQFPWATRRARIVGPVHAGCPEGNYIAVPLAPFDDVWTAAPNGTQMWLPAGKVERES